VFAPVPRQELPGFPKWCGPMGSAVKALNNMSRPQVNTGWPHSQPEPYGMMGNIESVPPAFEETGSHTLEMVEVFVLSFSIGGHFSCHFFCHFIFLCHFLVISFFFVIFLVIFCHCFCHVIFPCHFFVISYFFGFFWVMFLSF
jgi:hypothetical protein